MSKTTSFLRACAAAAAVAAFLRGAPARAAEAAKLRTGVYADTGVSGGGAFEWLRIVKESPELEMVPLSAADIRAGALDGVDVLVMPGGSPPAIKRNLKPEGAGRIRDFIRGGGGYIGTCAGCCLLMETAPDPSRGIGVMPFWRSGSKGRFIMPVRLNAKGAAATGLKPGTYMLQYSHGPVLEPSTNAIEGASFEVWGDNRSDEGRYGNTPEMFGRAAIVGGTYGKGRVFATSCHPEYLESSRTLVQGAFRWAGGRDITLPPRARKPRAMTVAFYAYGPVGTDAAKAYLALLDDPEIDVVPFGGDELRKGSLDHVDAIVFPHCTNDPFSPSTAKILERFVERGGKAFAWGRGKVRLPRGGTLCGGADAAVAAVKGAAAEAARGTAGAVCHGGGVLVEYPSTGNQATEH